ncbi:YgaP family membrane protein [Sandaracinobacteroides sp. A072]|uniref:YgaP family membrane protein n=1 Tax=Sandaracinobacteroides sp. A072 TaxID=3461146 RepID=UPI004041F76E
MNLDRAVFAFAGIVVLLSVALAVTVNIWWLALTAFAGFNLLQSAFTGFCPAAIVFKKLGIQSGNAFR